MNAPAIFPALNPDLPFNVELEQAVLGVCLARPEWAGEIMSACAPSDFADPLHARIMETIISLNNDDAPVSFRAVGVRMADDPGLKESGGSAYLEVMELAAPAAGYKTLARDLVDLRLRREILTATMDCQEVARRIDVDPLKAMRSVLDVADHVADTLHKRATVSLRDAADTMLRKAEDRANGKTVEAATTGVEALDKAIGGLQGGDMVVYAGRPGMGKSCLLAATALRSAMSGRPTIFFSLEMTQERLLQRIGCDLDFDTSPGHPLSYSWFRNGSAGHDDIGRMAEALTALPENLTIIENGSLTIQEVAAHSRAFAHRHDGMGVVVVDYLQKVNAGDRYRGNRVQEVTEISGAAKALALALKWPVVLGAQLNRGVESRDEKRPALTDLRESGSIEQDADAVIGLYRPGYYIDKKKPALGRSDPGWAAWEADWEADKNRLDLLVLKNRNGPEDALSVFCDMRASAIRSERPRGML